jgi:hypothetical protein
MAAVARTAALRRYRHSAAITVAALVALIAAIPITQAGWYFLPVLLIPLAVALWSWRSGTDLTREGLTVRAALGSRWVSWAEVDEIAADPRGRVHARLTNGHMVRLTAVDEGDLGAILEALNTRR